MQLYRQAEKCIIQEIECQIDIFKKSDIVWKCIQLYPTQPKFLNEQIQNEYSSFMYIYA